MTRVVFAHGFTQTGRSWRAVIEALTQRLDGFDPIAPDLPGHGDATDVVTDLEGSAEHLVVVGGRGAYVGYSMGGRTALHAALAHPASVDRLVLIGATAGLDSTEQRADRRASDRELADRIESIGVSRFLDAWLANPLFAGLTEAAADRDDRLRNTAAGLASSLRHAGTGTQQPLWGRLGEIRCPTLILVGEHDEKFRAIGERLAGGIADARLEVVGAAGHSVHLEQPDATVDALAEFLT